MEAIMVALFRGAAMLVRIFGRFWGKDDRLAANDCGQHSIEEVRVIRRLVAIVGLFAGLVPAIGHAQTNIDQGKSPAQIFASDCGVCHKAARGLAGGKNNAALTDFLRQHYTTGREQAASLAAYVLRGGGGDTGSTTAGQKPSAERAKASADAKPTADEPKPAKPQGRQAAKPETKPETGAASTTEVKRDEEPAATEEPGRRPASGRHETKSSRGRHKEQEAAPAPSVAHEPAAAPEPSAVVAEPNPAASAEPANPEPSPTTAAAPAEPASGDNAPVPRDNIPD
jgi:hypothetical protein